MSFFSKRATTATYIPNGKVHYGGLYGLGQPVPVSDLVAMPACEALLMQGQPSEKKSNLLPGGQFDTMVAA